MKLQDLLLENQNVNVTSTNIKDGRFIKSYDKVSGDFYCSDSKLTSLEGGPSSVNGDFYCYSNKLITLKGGPSSVGGSFVCYDNKLTTLEGSPSSVGGWFNSSINKLTSLEGIGKRYLRQMNGKLYLNENPIKSNVLGVLLIKGCQEIRMNSKKEVEVILNKHLKSDKDIIECREELISAGFKEFAKL